MHIFSNSTRCVDKQVYISLSNYSEKKKVGILASGKVKYPDVYLLFSLRYQPLKNVKKVLKKGKNRTRSCTLFADEFKYYVQSGKFGNGYYEKFNLERTSLIL